MSRRGRFRRAIAAGLLTWLSLQVLAPTFAAAVVVFTVQDAKITAPVGFALDSGRAVFWTANRTDKVPVAFGVDYAGVTAARLTLDVDTTGIGSIAYAAGKLYLGEFGDPNVAHRTLRVHSITPRLGTGSASARTFEFTFPDNAYMATSIVVNSSGRLLVLAKGAAGAIYAAPANLQSSNQLTRVASAPRDLQSATFMADGRLALRTAKSVVILDPVTYEPVAQAPVAAEEGSLISPSASGTKLLLADAVAGTVVRTLEVPTTMAVLETPSPTPTPSPSAAGSTAPTATQAPTTFEATGTLIAIAAAALLAFVAGSVVMLRR